MKFGKPLWPTHIPQMMRSKLMKSMLELKQERKSKSIIKYIIVRFFLRKVHNLITFYKKMVGYIFFKNNE